MRRFFARLAPPAVLLLVVSGCGGSGLPTDTPTEPAPTTKIETFPATGTGTLTPNGAFSYPFTVTAVGSMEAVLMVLEPDNPVGLALGTWNGSNCQPVVPNDSAIQGARVTANTTAVGDFCVRIYDATGTMAGPQTFQIMVAHQ